MSDVQPNSYSGGYFVRIFEAPTYLDKVRSLADQEDYTRVLCIRHEADATDPHPHYHIILETTVRDKAFWKRMTKLFDQAKGNGNAAHKVWDGKLEACAYMFHEDNDNANIIVNKGFSEADILAMKALNKEVKQRMVDAKSGSHTEKQLAKHKKTIWDVVEEVREAMPKRAIKFNFEERITFVGRMGVDGTSEYPEETAYALLISTLEKYKIRTNENEIKRWLDTILRIDPAFNYVKKNILSRYRHQDAS